MELSNVQANFENEFIAAALRLENGFAVINYGYNSGGYENYQYFVTADGGVLGINTVIVNIQKINFNDPDDSQFHIVGINVNYEDNQLQDDHTGEYLESAYGEDEDDNSEGNPVDDRSYPEEEENSIDPGYFWEELDAVDKAKE